jgi:hypothetical protein
LIRKYDSIKQALYVIAAIAVLLFNSYNSQQIFGHDFAGDESASFLALMDQMQTEMNLINTNLIANNNNQSSIAKDHLNKINAELYTEKIKKEIAERNERIANEISSIINEASITIGKEEENNNQEASVLVKNFNDVIEEAVSVRIDPDAMTNTTIQALRFADLINSIDISYATALGTKPMNMSAMNMATADDSMSHSNNSKSGNNTTTIASMNMDHRVSSNSNSNSMANMNKDTVKNSNATETSTITSIASYQTANELTNVAIDLFNSTIKQNIPSNATENTNAIESGLKQLKDMIESKAPYDKVMGVIHGIIQTNIQEAFNLPLKTSK